MCQNGPNGIPQCINPCRNIFCGQNEGCILRNSYPVCECFEDFVRNPITAVCESKHPTFFNPLMNCPIHTIILNLFSEPSIPDCAVDTDCATNSACRADALGVMKCVPVCDGVTCPSHASCVPSAHRGICRCLPGYIGNPNSREGCMSKPKDQCYSDSQCPEISVCKEVGDIKRSVIFSQMVEKFLLGTKSCGFCFDSFNKYGGILKLFIFPFIIVNSAKKLFLSKGNMTRFSQKIW